MSNLNTSYFRVALSWFKLPLGFDNNSPNYECVTVATMEEVVGNQTS